MKRAPGEQIDNVENVESAASMLEELAGMRKLHALQVSLAAQVDMRVALQDITALACTFARTECGCVQLVDEHSNDMELRVYRGHDERSPFVQQFLKDGFQATCDAVRRERRQLVIEDIETFTPLKGTPDYEAALCSGIRAAQFTPLFNRAGALLGLLSTQFTMPYRPAEHELRLLELLAWTAADYVERNRAQAALRTSEARLALVLDQIPIGVGLFDTQSRFTYRNSQLSDQLTDRIPSRDGVRAAEWQGIDQQGNPVPPQQFPGARALRGEDTTAPIDFRHLDGTAECWLRVTAVALRDGSRVTGGLTVVQDVTGQRRVQADWAC